MDTERRSSSEIMRDLVKEQATSLSSSSLGRRPLNISVPIAVVERSKTLSAMGTKSIALVMIYALTLMLPSTSTEKF